MKCTAPAHPVELLLLAGLVALQATITLLVALAALLLTIARWRPAASAPAAPAAPPAPPLQHPLLALAVDGLQPLTVAQLRTRARAAGLPRSLTRNGRRTDLLHALAGLEVAMA